MLGFLGFFVVNRFNFVFLIMVAMTTEILSEFDWSLVEEIVISCEFVERCCLIRLFIREFEALLTGWLVN